MAVIQNKWVEKKPKKKSSDKLEPSNEPKPCHLNVSRANRSKSLRGIRKQMQCKSCGYPDSHVVETKKDERLNQIIRRRECIKCGVRYNTQENISTRPGYKTSSPKKVLDR